MMGTVDARNMQFHDKIKFWILDASCWLFIGKFHSHSCTPRVVFVQSRKQQLVLRSHGTATH